MPHEAVAEFLATWGYPAFLALLVATAFGSPLNEDLLVLLGGYLVGAGVFAWMPLLAVAFVGVLTSDTLLYMFGRKLRAHTLRGGLVRRFIRPGRLRVGTRWFARFGDRLVFLSRLVPGTRVVVFVTAGFKGMPFARFLGYDAAGGLLWIPLLAWLGATLGERLGRVQGALEWIGDAILWLLVLAILAWVVRASWVARASRSVGDEEGL